ncbi:MAG: hypothetical protein JRM73_05240 [Nitrososphaerota archaeon]|nr:hypothetical protein [Nitrososphaerota archaeon]
MSTKTSLTGGFVIAVLAAALVLSGFGAAVAVGGIGQKPATTTTVTGTNATAAPYTLTLVLTTGNTFNSTVGEQPAYYVLGPNGLESSANISLPVNQTIKLVIMNYDDGNASLVIPNDNVVSGTNGGTVFVASNTNVNSSQGTNGINIVGGQSVTSVPSADLAHTFTVPALNLNVPVPLSSTVVAYFTITKAGTFIWFCETTCGFGTAGTAGAMSTAGWMTGSLVAS